MEEKIFQSGNWGKTARFDANDVMYFNNMLTEYDPKDYETLKPSLRALDFFNVNNINEIAQQYSYSQVDSQGAASYGDTRNGKANDFPFVNSTEKQHFAVMASPRSAMRFSIFDLKADAYLAKDKVGRLRRQTMRANFEAMNNTLFFGYQALGIPGLLNNKQLNAPAQVGNPGWATKTGDLILADLQEAFDAAERATNNLISPDTMMISAASLSLIKKKALNTLNPSVSIYDKFMEDNDIKNVVRCPELNSAFTGNSNGFILFNNNPDYIEHLVGTMYDTMPPQQVELGFVVYTYSSHGGLVIRQPKMFAIRYGC